MTHFYYIKSSILAALTLLFLNSCHKDFDNDDYVAYFGGEVINPNNPYVLFCKDNVVIDTIRINKDNTFFKKFDSLAPGLYTFKHEPEYQYVYFEKNDSLRVHIDSNDFDQSVVFCGRGDEKNNFLMEMYLRNENDKNNMFEVFDYDFKKFNSQIEKTNRENRRFYIQKKHDINWSDQFDTYATALYQFPYYTKKEIYPVIHKIRTGQDVIEQLPNDYYDFRQKIDYSNEALTEFSPFVMYINHMLNNVSNIKYHNHYTEVDMALKTNVNKLKIADTLIKNQKVKNIIINTIAFQYLLEDQNMVNNQTFFETYNTISTDRSTKNEIRKIGNAIKLLNVGKTLPNIQLIDKQGNKVNSEDLITGNTVFFFWTEKLYSHYVAAHNKVIDFQKKFPNYNFIAINLDNSNANFNKIIEQYNFKNFKEYRCSNFEEMKSKWAITKVHRTIIVNKDKTIKNGFTNMFEVNFEDNLK